MPLCVGVPRESDSFEVVARQKYELDVVCRLPDGDWQTVVCKQIGTGSQFDLSEVVPGFVIDIGHAP
jgi:hypothetical protein